MQKKQRNNLLGLACLLFGLGVFSFATAYAQTDATITLEPEHPGPYEKVTLTLSSYSFDVDLATISWFVNGKTALGGPGERSFSITTGGVGEASLVKARIVLVNGEQIEVDTLLSPQGISLIWEAPESYTPPFYEGRSLPAEGSSIRLVAEPTISSQGKRVPPEDIAYSWYSNGELLTSASGRGKRSATIPLEYLSNSTKIRVVARDTNGNSAAKEVTIYPTEVRPSFYLRDPTLGIDYSRNLGGRFETTGEFTLAFVPYFFSTNNGLGSTASYAWALDGLPIEPETNTALTFRPQESAVGLRTLTVNINNSKRKLQKAVGKLTILFDTR
jgi:hypothetical protein